MTEKKDPLAPVENHDSDPAKVCGIVRPIAAMGTYDRAHWQDVHDIVAEAAREVGFSLKLVSETDAAGVILSDIVTNLYFNEIVIADVSGRNPNVMFELGMRMAFEKPVIIITDDDTPFSFDISPVRHIQYPRSLRFSKINKFKDELGSSIVATLAATKERGHKGYLQQFGRIEVTKVGEQQVELSELAEGIQDLRRTVASLVTRQPSEQRSPADPWMQKISGHDLFVTTDKVDIKSLEGELTISISKSLTEQVMTALGRLSGVNARRSRMFEGDRRIIWVKPVDAELSQAFLATILGVVKRVDKSAYLI